MIPGDLTGLDEDRIVDLSEDEPLLPDSTTDGADVEWDGRSSFDERAGERWLQDERPPHWD